MTPAIPQIVYDLINIFASLIRLIGMAMLGVGIGYLAVDLLHKAQGWPLQALVFLGLAGLVIALVVFLSWGALGGFGIGAGVAIFIWAMPKKKKEDQE
jgi:hypothetical protein